MGQSFQQRMTTRPRLDQQYPRSSGALTADRFKKQAKDVSQRPQRYQNPIFRAVKYVKDRPWTSYDLSHEFFSTYRTLSQSQPRTRQLLEALTAKLIECPHHLKVDDVSAIIYSIDKSRLKCPTFADFLLTFSKRLRESPDRFTPRAAFHALYYLRNKINQHSHFIDTVEIGKDLSDEDYRYLQAFEKFVETVAMKVEDSKLGPTFQVSCHTIHQFLNPTCRIAIDNDICSRNYNDDDDYSASTTISPATLQKVTTAAYKCFRIERNVLLFLRSLLQEQLSLARNEDLFELVCPNSIDLVGSETNDWINKIRLLQAIWKLPNTDLPHSCIMVDNKDIQIKYNDITIDPSINMLKQQIVALLLGGAFRRTSKNEINLNDSVELERICVMIYDILELRRFYGRNEDIQEYIETKLKGDVQKILLDCIELKHKYIEHVAHQDTYRIFEEMQNLSASVSDSENKTPYNENVINFLHLKKILGEPVERNEPKFYMRGLFLR